MKTEDLLDLDFYPFGESADPAPAPVQRPTAKERTKAGPKSLGTNDAAIAERDNRKPMGRR